MSHVGPSTADTDPAPAESPPLSHRLRWLPWLILVLGAWLTWHQHTTSEQRRHELDRSRFEIQASEITSRLERRLHANVDLLRGVAGLFASSDHVDRDEFQVYVKTLRLDVNYPGIQGVGFSQWIPPEALARHEQAVHEEGFMDYRVHPEQPTQSHRSAIVYIEPFNWRNQRAFGFDMFSEPVRHRAMYRAVETGEPSLSGRVILIQETQQDTQPGFLIYVPIYLKGTPPTDPAERWSHLVGWAFSPIRSRDLINAFLDNEFPLMRQHFGLRLYASAEPDPDALLYDSMQPDPPGTDAVRYEGTVALHGVHWRLELERHDNVVPTVGPRWQNQEILWVGALLTVLLATLVHVMLRSHRMIRSALDRSVRAQRQLAKSQAALRLAGTVMDASPLGILVTDARRRIVSVNPAFTRITGYAASEAIGASTRLLDIKPLRNGTLKEIWRKLVQHGIWEGELESRRKDAAPYPLRLSITLVRDENGGIQNYIGLFQDITEQHKAQENIRRLAHHDYLTGLPNRALLVERASIELQGAQRYGHRPAILFIDLDRFKPINDAYGHEAGDAVLIEVAHRLTALLRGSDLVCRQGGDEFIVLMPDHHNDEGLLRLAHKLLQAIQEPYTVAGRSLELSASIGISVYPEDGATLDDLIRSADTAMYRAKASPTQKIWMAGAKESDPATR